MKHLFRISVLIVACATLAAAHATSMKREAPKNDQVSDFDGELIFNDGETTRRATPAEREAAKKLFASAAADFARAESDLESAATDLASAKGDLGISVTDLTVAERDIETAVNELQQARQQLSPPAIQQRRLKSKEDIPNEPET